MCSLYIPHLSAHIPVGLFVSHESSFALKILHYMKTKKKMAMMNPSLFTENLNLQRNMDKFFFIKDMLHLLQLLTIPFHILTLNQSNVSSLPTSPEWSGCGGCHNFIVDTRIANDFAIFSRQSKVNVISNKQWENVQFAGIKELKTKGSNWHGFSA